MTRNHYEALARVLREEREFIQSLPSAQYPDSEVKAGLTPYRRQSACQRT